MKKKEVTMNTQIITKSKIVIPILITVSILAIILIIPHMTVSAAEKVQINLQNMRDAIDEDVMKNSELALSSNPYDYIEDNEYYDNIIKLGVRALPELERTLSESDSNGLNEYILAIAIETISHVDIRKIKDDEFAWETAKGFEKEWIDIRENANTSINEIVQSDKLSSAEKVDKLSAYGVLAVSELKKVMRDSTLAPSFKTQLEDILNEYVLSDSDEEILNQYIKQ